MVQTISPAIYKTLAETLRDVDVLPNQDFLPYFPVCWASTKQGLPYRNRSYLGREEKQFGNLSSKFKTLTECSDTSDFYNQMEVFIALTYCKRHYRQKALDAFTIWRANRRAALNLLLFTSPLNEVLKNKQHDDSLETLQ